MKLEKRKTDELKFYPGNPRKMDRKEMEKLKKSISEFGLVDPLIVNKDNEVIGGNQRLKVIKTLGIKEVDVVVVDLPKSKEKALNIALNKIQGEWDVKLLKDFIDDIEPLDLEISGLDDEELSFEGTGWNPEKFKDVAENGDGIENIVGYSLSSFWKDLIKEKAETFKYRVELPINKTKSGLSNRYSRTNAEEIEKIVKTYMRPGDYFLENCVGWATFSSAAKYFGYSGVGVDIWDTALEVSKKQIEKMPGEGQG